MPRHRFLVLFLVAAIAACGPDTFTTIGDALDGEGRAEAGSRAEPGELHLSGELARGDVALSTGAFGDRYELHVIAGTTAEIVVQSADFDTYLQVVTPSGRTLVNDDAPGRVNQSRLVVAIVEDGSMKVTATSYGASSTGRYRLDVSTTANASPAGTDAGPAAAVARAFRDGSGSTADFIPNALRIARELLGSRPHHRVDLPPPAAPPAPTPTPTTAAPTAPAPTTGQDAAQGAPIEMGSQTEGRLEAGDETLATGERRDLFSFEGQAGTPVNIELQSEDFDPFLMLVSPSGQQWENDDVDLASNNLNSQILMSLPESGTYRIVATSYRPGEQGAYLLKLRTGSGGAPADPASPTAPAAPAAATGAARTISGALEASDQRLSSGEHVDRHAVTFQSGRAVQLRLASSDFDTYLLVRSPSGRQWDNDDFQSGSLDSGLDLVPPESGEYSVAVTSYRPGETGAYTLTATHGGGEAGAAPAPGAPTPQSGAPVISPPGMPGSPLPAAAPGAVRPQPAGGRVYGIYVGITDYPSGRLPLCAEDAIKLAQDMRRAGLQSEAEQIVLTDANATAERIRQAFADMSRRVGPNDLFIFFYSGHGSQGGEQGGSSELDRREESINTYQGDITDDEMGRLFGQIRARVSIIALDSCFSGGFARDVVSAPGRMGFFSSEEDLTSSAAARFQAGGYLSHFLRLGLRGEGDTSPRDSQLTAGELSHYLYTMYGRHMQDVRAETTDSAGGYQHLVIDRGSVRVSTPLVQY